MNSSIRQQIRTYVTNINPFDELEKEHIDDVLQWIDNNNSLFRIEKPDKPAKHLVSYFLLVDKANQSILLVDHIKAQLWLPTGGHVEIDEDPKETVKRESLEELDKEAIFLDNNESPLFITVTKTVGLTAGHTDVSFWFMLKGDVNEKLTYDKGEFNKVKWFTYDEVLQTPISKFDPHLHRLVNKLLSYSN